VSALSPVVQGGSGALVVGPTAGWTEVAPFYEEPFADHWFEKPLEP
jgi:hypothetical protein